jgi:hypothetical protein
MTVDDTLHITGGAPLYGTVPVRGSKNAVPKLMVAALLTEHAVTIRNVSFVRDIGIVADLVEALGSTTTSDPAAGVVTITARDLHVADQGELAGFHEHPGQLVLEDLAVGRGGEVAVLLARLAVAAHDPVDELAQAGLAGVAAGGAAEVLRGHDVGRVDRPEVRELDAALLEVDRPIPPVGHHHVAALPGDLVVRMYAGGGVNTLDVHPTLAPGALGADGLRHDLVPSVAVDDRRLGRRVVLLPTPGHGASSSSRAGRASGTGASCARRVRISASKSSMLVNAR